MEMAVAVLRSILAYAGWWLAILAVALFAGAMNLSFGSLLNSHFHKISEGRQRNGSRSCIGSDVNHHASAVASVWIAPVTSGIKPPTPNQTRIVQVQRQGSCATDPETKIEPLVR